MFNRSHFLGKFIMLVILGLLTLTLFDSNPWWKVFLFAIPAVLLNLFLTGLAVQNSWPALVTAPVQGVAAAFLAYLAGLTPLFRTTSGTLAGFALLLGVAEYLLAGFFLRKNHE
ncbi:MAG: hypothetical protein GX251_04205 [Firmicutes bacterium]|nr:hypothetical protein [Bacillota bacterium]